PRSSHAAVLLLNGRVLVSGGHQISGNRNNIFSSAEVYDPASGTFTLTTALGGTDMTAARDSHTMTLIEDGPAKGNVLAAGGNGGAWNTAEIFDPARNSITRTTALGGSDMNAGHETHTATWLGGINQVLIVGGVDLTGNNAVVTAAAELFDP